MRGKAFESYFKIIILTVVTLCLTTLSSHKVQAQSDSLKLVKGVVTDENQKPVEKATVQVVGASRGASTDSKGVFSIRVAKGDKLEISHIGKAVKIITYAGETSLSITLMPDEQKGMLDEVTVISTGYQNLDRKMFTGASDKLLAKDVERSGVPDLSRMLEGQSAGVSVQNVSGTFGAAPKIRIRGATSLNGDNKPLWVIDGIILEDMVNISNEARDYFAHNKAHSKLRLSQAIVIDGLAQKIVGNFYKNFHRPACPVELFSNEEDAIKWIRSLS